MIMIHTKIILYPLDNKKTMKIQLWTGNVQTRLSLRMTVLQDREQVKRQKMSQRQSTSSLNNLKLIIMILLALDRTVNFVI
jgi:hypothetical protein